MGRALGVELDQVVGELFEAFLDALLGVLPLHAAHLVEAGCGALAAAAVAVEQIDLVHRHEELVVVVVDDRQVLTLLVVDAQARQAREAADAVLVVHHEVAGLELGGRAELGALVGELLVGLGARAAVLPEELEVGEHHKPHARPGEAFEHVLAHDPHAAGHAVGRVRRGGQARVDGALVQDGEGALGLLRDDDDPLAGVLPLVHLHGDFVEVRVEARRRRGLDLEVGAGGRGEVHLGDAREAGLQVVGGGVERGGQRQQVALFQPLVVGVELDALPLGEVAHQVLAIVPPDHRAFGQVVQQGAHLGVDEGHVVLAALEVAEGRELCQVLVGLGLEAVGDEVELLLGALEGVFDGGLDGRPVALGKHHLAGGEDVDATHRLARALGLDVELAQAVDVVAEPLDAHRALGVRREHVHDAAAARELAALRDLRARPVAEAHELADERLGRELLAHAQLLHGPGPVRGQGHAQPQRAVGGDDPFHVAAHQPGEHGLALGQLLALRRDHLVGRNVDSREVGCFESEGLEVRLPAPGLFGRARHQHPGGAFFGGGCQQEGLGRAGDAVDRHVTPLFEQLGEAGGDALGVQPGRKL
ncbi:hypothetical protein D3C72_983960 [compost metagenome]